MNPISPLIVEMTWQSMARMEEQDVNGIINDLKESQPELLVYLVHAGGDVFNRHEREALFYIGLVVYRMMATGTDSLHVLSGEYIDECEAANFDLIEKLAFESPGDFIAVTEKLLQEYNQIEVLRYAVQATMEEDEEIEEISDETKVWMLICLKTIIDALDVSA